VKKFRICIIGAGRVGSALAKHFYSTGIQIEQIVDYDIKKAKNLAVRTNSKMFSNKLDILSEYTNIICISVQDRNIQEVVNYFLEKHIILNSVFVFHTSGSETSEVLKPLRKLGAEVFSFHPLFSFASEKINYDLLNTFVAVESDSRRAINFAEIFCKEINCKSIVIQKDKKALYHAFAVLISNYLAILLSKAENSILNKKSKIKPEQLYKPLIESTLKNLTILGVEKGLTGPIVRGDNETIEKNISALNEYYPELADIYKSFMKLVK